LVGMEISPATMEINMGVPQKTKNRTRTTIWSRYTTPGYVPEESKSAYNRGACTACLSYHSAQ
jgi:hypothetical protein